MTLHAQESPLKTGTCTLMARWAAMAAVALLGLSGCLGHHQGALPDEPADATYMQLDQARVRYIDRGQGPAVVLIHGFAASLNTWDPVVKVLEADHRVIALDLKGFGWSDRPEGDYSPLAQARLVMALMDQLGVERAAVVAHSWGSSVALALALEAPDRVERLALYDAWIYEEQLPSFFHWARLGGIGEALVWAFYDERADDRMALAFHDPRYVTEALVEDVDATLARPGVKAAALAAIRGQRYAEVQHRYAEIDKPTLLLWGREDQVTLLAFGEALARQLPQARLVVYPRCGHFPMIEARAASTAELRAFLAETFQAGTPAQATPAQASPTEATPAAPAKGSPAPAEATPPAPTGASTGEASP